MNLKNKLLLLPILLYALGIFAQQGPGRERIKTLKVAFITEQLNLSREEAQLFWPVYNAHEQKIADIRKKERQQFGGRLANLSQTSPKEAEVMVATYAKLQSEKHAVEQDFIADLKEVIPALKIIKLFRAEESFKKRLLQQYQKRRGGG